MWQIAYLVAVVLILAAGWRQASRSDRAQGEIEARRNRRS
jgi:hypothetical protein